MGDTSIDIVTGQDAETGAVWDDAVEWAKGAVDTVTAPVGDALDALWDQLDDLPGFKQLGEGTKALFKGPLREFANSGIGQTVLRAMATMASGGLAFAGPYAMMAAHAMPAMVAGHSFSESILSENLWRLEKTAEIMGADVAKAATEHVGKALTKIKEELAPLLAMVPDAPQALRQLIAASGKTPEQWGRELAGRLGIREDMAVQAVEMVLGERLLDHGNYNINDGRDRRFAGATKSIAASPLSQGPQSAALQAAMKAAAVKSATATRVTPAGLGTPSLLSNLAAAAARSAVATPVNASSSSFSKNVDILSSFHGSSKVPAPAAPPPPPPPPMADMMRVMSTRSALSSAAPEQGGDTKTVLYVGAAGMLGLAVWWFMRRRR